MITANGLATVADATPESAELARLKRDEEELAAAMREVQRVGVLMKQALARLAEAQAWASESRREAGLE